MLSNEAAEVNSARRGIVAQVENMEGGLRDVKLGPLPGEGHHHRTLGAATGRRGLDNRKVEATTRLRRRWTTFHGEAPGGRRDPWKSAVFLGAFPDDRVRPAEISSRA